MLKTAMFVSALALSTATMAQDQTKPAPDQDKAAPAQSQTAPTEATETAPVTPQAQEAAQGAPIPGAPVVAETPTTAPAEIAATPTAAPAPTEAPAAETAATPTGAPTDAPVTGATQIAQVVDTEFPAYDKNADSALDKSEFGAWMVALKTASDPSTKADDPATVQWVSGAFASADLDKSSTVSKTELTTYLSKGSAE